MKMFKRNGNEKSEGGIRTLTLGLIGAAAVAAGLLLLRNQKQSTPKESITSSASKPGIGEISLDRLRELGI